MVSTNWHQQRELAEYMNNFAYGRSVSLGMKIDKLYLILTSIGEMNNICKCGYNTRSHVMFWFCCPQTVSQRSPVLGCHSTFISVSNLSQERLLLPCCFSMTAKALPATPCKKMVHDCLMSWEKRDHHRILLDCCRRTRPTECYSNWEEALVQ